MATKAELEIELASLRKELAERDTLSTKQQESGSDTSTATGTAPENGQSTVDAIDETNADSLDEVFAALQEGDLGALARQFEDEIGNLSQNSPVLTTLGAFLLGYLLGKAR
jgi:hypothetical protein